MVELVKCFNLKLDAFAGLPFFGNWQETCGAGRTNSQIVYILPLDILEKVWYNSIKERRDVQMTARDMVIAILENDIESMEKEVENLRMEIVDKIEQLEKYYNLFNILKERG